MGNEIMWEKMYENVKNDPEIRELIRRGNANLGILGYTDHSEAHTALVAEKTAWILKEFGHDEHMQVLGKTAGFMHDIGNAVNRSHHAEYGGILANEILKRYAALIIADKTDVPPCCVISGRTVQADGERKQGFVKMKHNGK